MPEEFENQEVVETESTESLSVEGEPKTKDDGMVPRALLDELRTELRASKESETITRNQMTNLMSEFQKMASGQANKAQEMVAKLDPAVQAELEPYFAPIKNQLEEERKGRQALENELRTVKAKEYIYSNIPNFNELKPHLEKFIQSEYTPEERSELSPKELVRIAKFVAKQQEVSINTKGAARSMAHTESGSSSNRPDPSKGDIDSKVKAWMEKNRDIL
jgi:hypothetical protein